MEKDNEKEANGFQQRLAEACINSEKITVVFLYPNSPKITVRKGNVLKVTTDSFDFQDRYEGLMTFAYDFIIEINEWNDYGN